MAHGCMALVLAIILSQFGVTATSDLPHFRAENGTPQFVE